MSVVVRLHEAQTCSTPRFFEVRPTPGDKPFAAFRLAGSDGHAIDVFAHPEDYARLGRALVLAGQALIANATYLEETNP